MQHGNSHNLLRFVSILEELTPLLVCSCKGTDIFVSFFFVSTPSGLPPLWLPLLKGDVEFATQCHQAFLDGQVALDNFLWNETAQHYNAYSTVDFDYKKFVNESHLEVFNISDAGADSKMDAQDEEDPAGQMCLEGDPATPGAIMADSFYSQVGKKKVFFSIA